MNVCGILIFRYNLSTFSLSPRLFLVKAFYTSKKVFLSKQIQKPLCFLPIIDLAGTAFHSSQNVINDDVTKIIPEDMKIKLFIRKLIDVKITQISLFPFVHVKTLSPKTYPE